MKICILTSLYAPYAIGGAERVAQTQAEALAARGHRVHVLTLGEPGTGSVRTELNGVSVVRVGIQNFYLPVSFDKTTRQKVAWHARDVYNTSMARAAGHWLTQIRPDIVVCHNIAGWSVAIWQLVKSLKLPLVQVLHDQYLRCVRSNMFTTRRCETPCMSCRMMRIPHRRLSRLPDAAVGVSRFVIDSLAQTGYFKGVAIRGHIYNASHIDTRAQAVRALDSPELVFGFIGSITPSKGVEALLVTFRRIAQPNWRLRIAGTGASDYVSHLRASHADARIEFVGRQDPTSFYSGVDAVVVPSLWDDTFPSVVFEALVHGRPVIGSRRGGIPEIIRHRITGLLYGAEDDKGLEYALMEFASTAGEWRSRHLTIKAEATARYCDRVSWIAQWEEVFARATENAARD